MPSAPSAGTDVGSFGENLSPGESDMLCITNTCTINKYKQKEEGVSEENVVIIIPNVREMRLKLHKRRSKSSSHIQQSAFFFPALCAVMESNRSRIICHASAGFLHTCAATY